MRNNLYIYLKNCLALTIIVILFGSGIVFAQEKSATPSSSTASSSALQIDPDTKKLLDKIPKIVSDMTKDKNNKAISGFATEVKGSIIKITDEKNEVYEVKQDDAISKYYQISGTTKKEIKLSDIKKNMFLIVTGLLNDKIITANTIYVDELFLVKSGKITEVNKEDFILKVVSSEKDYYNLEIQVSTKQQMFNIKTKLLETSGFSKIKEGDTIHFVVKKIGDEKDNTFNARKTLIIPQEFFMK